MRCGFGCKFYPFCKTFNFSANRLLHLLMEWPNVFRNATCAAFTVLKPQVKASSANGRCSVRILSRSLVQRKCISSSLMVRPVTDLKCISSSLTEAPSLLAMEATVSCPFPSERIMS